MTQAAERPPGGLVGVEFVDAEGLAELDAMFEEEFNASDEHIEFVGGSSNSVVDCSCSMWVSPGELGEDPVGDAAAALARRTG